MSEVTKTLSNFVQQVVARLKGDDAEVLALKNERKAQSALRSQISSLESKIVDDEISLENAKEALEVAKYPTTLIVDNKRYVDDLAAAQRKVNTAQETLDATTESKQYFEKLFQNL